MITHEDLKHLGITRAQLVEQANAARLKHFDLPPRDFNEFNIDELRAMVAGTIIAEAWPGAGAVEPVDVVKRFNRLLARLQYAVSPHVAMSRHTAVLCALYLFAADDSNMERDVGKLLSDVPDRDRYLEVVGAVKGEGWQ